jgi:hypothetical protein
MNTELKLEIEGISATAHLRQLIETQLGRLEARCGRITACRLVVRKPGPHHRLGAPFAVSLALSLPTGRSVNVGRISKNVDPRQGDLVFAVNDAFRRAMRQLTRQAGKLNH